MSKILSVIALILVAGLATVLVLASQKPDDFHVERSIVIDAPPAVIFEQVNNLENSQKWSPWVEMDPDAVYEFEGPVAGEGATLHWSGDKSGVGTMTITESRPQELVRFRLDFKKPMEDTSTAAFVLQQENGQTKVTWSMDGEAAFIHKVMSVFMNCEAMIGEQFEKGLTSLKGVVEG